jgi:hypothetical protein
MTLPRLLLLLAAVSIGGSAANGYSADGTALQSSVIFGGSGYEMGLGATDEMGNTYVTGATESTNFPVTADSAQPSYGGGDGDAFVTKVDANGDVVYSTYLGGNGFDEGRGVAVDSAGYLWIAGYTSSTDFPTGSGDTTLAGATDAFIARLSPDGSLVSSTLLGGEGVDHALALTLDGGGNAYVTGETASSDFPTTTGAFDRTSNGDFDAFAAKFSPTSGVVYSSLLGGPGFDNGLAIAVDGGGSAYITGKASAGYPVTPGAFDTTQNGGYDMFVTKVGPAGSALTYSTYVGGDSWDEGLGIAVDGEGNAYFTGNVQSANYPVTPGAVGGALRGRVGAAATKVNSSGTTLIYSGVIGGSDWDEGDALRVDSNGAAYIAGHQASADFPTTPGALDTTSGGGVDGFLVKVDPTGTSLLYSTFVGGNGWDGAMAMTVGDGGLAYLTGATTSTDFPSTRSAGARGGFDVFATTVATEGTATPPPPPPPPPPATFELSVLPTVRAVVAGESTTYTAVVTKEATEPEVSLAVAGLPEDATATFVRSGDSTTITISTSKATPPGGYELRVVGRGGDVNRTATVRLDVHCCYPPG